MGADGLLLITPYYNKSNEEGIYQHFKTVADAVDIPCILYNIPGRCGCGISERNVERLAAHPNIMGIKEASGNVAILPIAHLLSDDFRMYSGEDALTVPLSSLGTSGTVALGQCSAQLVHDMCRAYLDGDVARARDIQIAGQPLINALFSEVKPIPVKEALAQMGMIEANYRMPLYPMANDTRSALLDALKGAGLLDSSRHYGNGPASLASSAPPPRALSRRPAGRPVFDIVAQIGWTCPSNAPAADVIIDFSNVATFDAVVAYVERTGAALVSGTTGCAPSRWIACASWVSTPASCASGNYSIGIAALRHLVAQATRELPGFDCEIVETHHNQKVDAPQRHCQVAARCRRRSRARGRLPPPSMAARACAERATQGDRHALAARWHCRRRARSPVLLARTRRLRSRTAPRVVRSLSTAPSSHTGTSSPAGLYTFDQVMFA